MAKPIVVNISKSKKKKKRNSEQSQPKEKELTRLGSALRTLGSIGGGALGGLVGYGSQGSGLGHSLGAALSKWLGSGDYRVASNSIVQRGSASIPAMHTSDQTIVVRHREFIQTITSSTNFVVRAILPLNPGLPGTFPWLSSIASNYQEYRIKGAVFHYVPTSGQFTGATNPALGTVMFQTVYRADDSVPTTKYELLNEYWANETMPCDTMVHPIECANNESVLTRRYIRDGAVSDNLMFYDTGKTIVAVQGQQTAGQILGDLWITYEVELKKPKMYASVGRAVRGALATVSSPALASRLYDNSVVQATSFVGDITFTSAGTNLFRVSIPAGNPGSYQWTTIISGTSVTLTGTPSGSGTNTTAINNVAENSAIPSTSATSIRAIVTTCFSVNDPSTGAAHEISGLTFAGTFSVTIFITSIDADFVSAV